MTVNDDQRLIAECLEGNKAAFDQLVCAYQDRLYNTVYRLVNNAEDAQDVVQDAFINAYTSLGSFKGDSLFFTWLYRIAINSAITLKRKKKVFAPLGDKTGEGVAEPADQSDLNRPGFQLERSEEDSRIHKALSRLSPEHRVVLVMKELEGHKYEDIAEVIGVPVGTVRSRLHRARLELREILEQDGP